MLNPSFEELSITGNLPSPPGVVLEILKLTQLDEVSIDELSHLVKSDQVLTGLMLKIANSAENHRGRSFVSVPDAIGYLGTKVLAKLAALVAMVDLKRNQCQGFDYENFWQTSLLRATAMHAISRHTAAIPAEEAFTLGLIVEIGQLALAQIYFEKYGEYLSALDACQNNHPFCMQCSELPTCLKESRSHLIETEKQLFGIDRHQITLVILKSWNLPDNIIDAVDLYQKSDVLSGQLESAAAKTAAQLQLASALAEQNHVKLNLSGMMGLCEGLDLRQSQFNEILRQLFLDWCEWKEILTIALSEVDKANPQITPRTDATPASNDAMRIMLVDDDSLLLYMLSKYLIQQGCEVFNTNSLDSALPQIISNPPQVLIVNQTMITMDGMALSKVLRSNTQTKEIYIIQMVTNVDQIMLAKAYELGVNDLLIKPINMIELDTKLLAAKQFITILQEQNRERESIRAQAMKLASNSRQLEASAFTDPLTALPNRRRASSRLDEGWAVFLDSRQPFAILMLDLDKFKQINDNYGHDVGDQVLIHFSKTLNDCIRQGDIACRMGGEEFIIIAPNTDTVDVTFFGERIREKVEKNQPAELQLAQLVTVSIGAAISNAHFDPNGWQDTLKRADQALYAAKASGRNTFKLSQEGV